MKPSNSSGSTDSESSQPPIVKSDEVSLFVYHYEKTFFFFSEQKKTDFYNYYLIYEGTPIKNRRQDKHMEYIIKLGGWKAFMTKFKDYLAFREKAVQERKRDPDKQPLTSQEKRAYDNKDNFNKNAQKFAENPFAQTEPTPLRRPVPLIPEDVGLLPVPTKHEKERIDSLIQGKVHVEGPQKSKDKTGNFGPLQPPVKVEPPKPTILEPELSDDESSHEGDSRPNSLLPERVLVAEHVPYFSQVISKLSDLAVQSYSYIANFKILFAIFATMCSGAYAIMQYNSVRHLMSRQDKIAHKQRVLSWFVKTIMIYGSRQLLLAFIYMFFNLGVKPIRYSTRTYLTKTDKKIQDSSTSVIRHRTQQLTTCDKTEFHYYQYTFAHHLEVPVLSRLNMFLPDWMKLPEFYESSLHAASTPNVFEKYTTFSDDNGTKRKTGKIEVVSTDLFQRLLTSSTFNLMNGVEQCHGRVSNVINSSNDIVIHSDESMNSSINGTKNLLSYVIKQRYHDDPNRHFHKGSPESSSMDIECSVYQIDGDPLLQMLLSTLSVYIILNELCLLLSFQRVDLPKFLWGYILKISVFLTPIYRTPPEQSLGRSRDQMQQSLSSNLSRTFNNIRENQTARLRSVSVPLESV